MMKQRYGAGKLLLATLLLLGVAIVPVRAVDDGRGTNVVNALRVKAIDFGQEVRTNWPSVSGSIGGMVVDVVSHSNQLIWGSVICWNGQLQKAQMQVDSGAADVAVVRAAWNDAWGACTTINTLHVTTDGVEDATWTSAWVSNDYRVGIVVTNCTGGSNLWWSVTYGKE